MTPLPHLASPRALSLALSCHCTARSADTASSFFQSSFPREAFRVGKSARHQAPRKSSWAVLTQVGLGWCSRTGGRCGPSATLTLPIPAEMSPVPRAVAVPSEGCVALLCCHCIYI